MVNEIFPKRDSNSYMVKYDTMMNWLRRVLDLPGRYGNFASNRIDDAKEGKDLGWTFHLLLGNGHTEIGEDLKNVQLLFSMCV